MKDEDKNSLDAFRLIRQSAREYNNAVYKFYKGGFIKYVDEGISVFVMDIYVEPEFRHTPVSSMMLESFQKFLEENSKIFVYGYVMKKSKDYAKRIATFEKWGLKITLEKDDYSVVGCSYPQLKGRNNG